MRDTAAPYLVFSKRLIRPDTWIIQLGNDKNQPATYVVIGAERAAVIDTGEHLYDLRSYVEEITDKPLVVVNTHSHFDHTGNNGLFKDCPIYMSVEATREVKHNIHRGKDPANYDFDWQPIGVPEGFHVDLGGRDLEAIYVPCHSVTSFAWLDRKHKLLFSGDEVETGQVLIMGKGEHIGSVEAYLSNLMKLKKYRDEGLVDLVCPAHNGSPADGSLIDASIENCRRIMAGERGTKRIASPSFCAPGTPEAETRGKQLADRNVWRSEWKGSSIVYDADHIFGEGA